MLYSKQEKFKNHTKWLYFIVQQTPTLFWEIRYNIKIRFSLRLLRQGWIGYAGTHVPMFVHKLGLIKPRQT